MGKIPKNYRRPDTTRARDSFQAPATLGKISTNSAGQFGTDLVGFTTEFLWPGSTTNLSSSNESRLLLKKQKKKNKKRKHGFWRPGRRFASRTARPRRGSEHPRPARVYAFSTTRLLLVRFSRKKITQLILSKHTRTHAVRRVGMVEIFVQVISNRATRLRHDRNINKITELCYYNYSAKRDSV